MGKGFRLRNGKDAVWWTRRNSEFRLPVKLCADFENRKEYHWTAGIPILSLLVMVMQ